MEFGKSGGKKVVALCGFARFGVVWVGGRGGRARWKGRKLVSRMGLEGVSEELVRMANGCMDQAPQRRKVREAFKDVQLGIDHCLFKVCWRGFSFMFNFLISNRKSVTFTCYAVVICLYV